MSTDTPDPRMRAALSLVDSPYLGRDDAGLADEERVALDVIARIMGEFHALAPPGPAEREPVFRWGTLDVFEEIGRGSFGVVYLARDRGLDLEVALKLQPLDDDGDAHAILAEARRLARVRHVNVCTVLGVDTHDGQVGLWTDHVPGRTLASRLEDGPLSVPETIRVGVQLCRALQAVHVADLVHGDITATNVIESPDGRIVLADFGSSMARAAGLAAAIPRTGTPLSMAPELFTGGTLDGATDVYALGALLFRLLTGEHLVAGRTVEEIARAHRLGDRQSLTTYRDDVPSPLAEVVSRATATRPEDRYPSALAMGDVLSASGVPPNNLPASTTSFVGRKDEVGAIRAALEHGRLVTLTGTGGVGKTRLAVEVAREELHRHADGVWLAELDDVPESDAVPERLASACALLGLTHAAAGTVAAALADRRLLLVIDNCERVSAAVASLAATLIARAPAVTVLCTSRVALGVPGEIVHTVSPLPVVTDGSEPVGAVRLFLDRLPPQTRPPDGAERAYTIEAICRHVDGIPLALELAAARAPAIGLTELERRLAKHLAVLSAPGGSRPERHRTMQALVAWSADLLDDEGASALTMLGVFPGSFALRAAEEILTAVDPTVLDPLNTLIRLLDDSLMERLESPDGRSDLRCRLPVPVREFAAAALEDHPDSSRVRDFFHAWFAQYAIEVVHETPRDGRPLEIVHADYHNIRPAVDAYVGDPDRWETAAELVIGLFDYWFDRGSRGDADGAVEHILAGDACVVVTPTLARLRYLSGTLAMARGDRARAQSDVEAALSHYQSLGMVLEESKALSALGLLAGHRSRDEAVALLEKSVQGYREAGEIALEGEAYNNIGSLFLTTGAHDTARAYFDRAAPLLRRAQFDRSLAHTLMNLARLDVLEEDESAASKLLGEAGAAARRASDLHTAAFCDALRGEALVRWGDADAAVPVLEESIGLAHRLHDERTTSFAHIQLARAHTMLGDREAALEHALTAVRIIDEHPFAGREDAIRLGVREAGYVAALCESWFAAAWMLDWSADYAARNQRTVSPHERRRFGRVSEHLVVSVGPTWRGVSLDSPPTSESDALARARGELDRLAGRPRG